jgi:hypothetical protein
VGDQVCDMVRFPVEVAERVNFVRSMTRKT